MTRLRRLLYLSTILIVLPVVFVTDVVRAVVDLDVGGLWALREVMLVGAFLAINALLDDWRKHHRRGIAKEIGRLLILTIVALIFFGTLVFTGAGDLIQGTDAAQNDSVLGMFWGTISGVVLGFVAIWTLQTVREIVLFKRRKETKRNFVVFLVLLLLSCAGASPIVPLEGGFLLSLFLPLTVVAIVVISFRQNWIVYLSRREKVYTLIYAGLLFFAGLFYVVLLFQESAAGKEFDAFSRPLLTLTKLNALLTTIYFGMAFVTTLFHLPTAEVFERKQSEINSLHNLTRLTTQVLDFNTLVETVTQLTQEVCGARSVWLELITPASSGGWKTQVVANRNITLSDLEAVSEVFDPSLREILMETKKVVLVDDTWSDRRTKSVKELGVLRGSLASVPLTSHGEVIGILHASKDLEHGFDQDDVDVLTTFGDHVTIAIENARLIARSIERERLQQELQVAKRMQKQLLPQVLPVLEEAEFAAMSESSAEVGGDYFDIVKLSETTWAIAVGDVSGKGVSAAFYMAEVKGIVLSLSKVYASPKELLARANDALHGSLDKRSFISLVYGILDTEAGTFRLARAGHCPMIYAANSGTVLVRPNGLGLGIADSHVFTESTEEQILKLNEGDVCVMYTDGITEARNPSGEEFGYDRLLRRISEVRERSADEIKIRILDTVRTFVSTGTYMDDMTLVVVKWLRTNAHTDHSSTSPASEVRKKKETKHE